jgi:hypothetical protein
LSAKLREIVSMRRSGVRGKARALRDVERLRTREHVE